ncbi:MAG: response regulator transcription factor [Burkholderiales bacterium]|nr:response regulator transcription factor [Burkholderiales bacterium]
MRALVLEDDAAQGNVLVSLLQDAGYEVQWYMNGYEVIRVLSREPFDLVLLDWWTPGASGREVLDWIREQLKDPLPVIFISQQNDEASIVDALTHGADDYLSKPIRPTELMARIATVKRRQGRPVNVPSVLRVGPVTVDRTARHVLVKGQIVELTQKEFDLAWFLLSHIGQLVPRIQALQAVWGGEEPLTSRTLDTHVSRLRRKLNLTPENGFRLVSIYSYGYRIELIDEPDSTRH